MACELLARMAMLALDGPARAWEPKPLRLRLFTTAGRIVRGRRRLRRDLAMGHPDHHRDHPPAEPGTWLTSRNRPGHQESRPAGPWNPASPARQPGHSPRPGAENNNRLPAQPDRSRSRNIKVNDIKYLPVRITQANRSDMAMRQRGILHGADQSADHHLQRLVSLVSRSHSAARWIAAREAEEIQAPALRARPGQQPITILQRPLLLPKWPATGQLAA